MAIETRESKNLATLPKTSVQFGWVESILPQLILVTPGSAQMSDSERRQLQDCIQKCEYILKGKEQLEKLQQALQGARAFERTKNDNISLEAFFARQTFVGDRSNVAGELLYDLRLSHAQGHLERLPKDVIGWLTEWEKRVHAAVCEASLQAQPRVGEKTQQMMTEWHKRYPVAARGMPGFFGKLRVLRLAYRARKQARMLRSLRTRGDALRSRIPQKRNETARLAGLLAIFLKVPFAQSGNYAHKVQQLVLLGLEKELSEVFARHIHTMNEKLNATRAQIERKSFVPAEVRRRITEIESQKNTSLVSIYAKRNIDIKQLMSDAAVYQMRAAFAELETRTVQKSQEVSQLQARLESLRAEIHRLSRIMEDHLSQVNLLERNRMKSHVADPR